MLQGADGVAFIADSQVNEVRANKASLKDLRRKLRENGIEVTALHNHMLDDRPRLFFMHFWANDDVSKLANGLKMALAKVNTSKH